MMMTMTMIKMKMKMKMNLMLDHALDRFHMGQHANGHKCWSRIAAKERVGS